MSLARVVITAVTVEGRSKSSVARDYGVTRFWVQTLVKRFEAEGEAAYEPHSRRPHTNPRAVSLDVEDQIVRLRKTLTKNGLDAGAETIAAHLADAGVSPVPATSTIWRILRRRGFVVAQPQKRPRSSWKTVLRRPAQRTLAGRHHPLAPRRRHRGRDRQHPRRPLPGLHRLDRPAGLHRHPGVAGVPHRDGRWGMPAEVLTDNGAVFTGKQRGQGRVTLEVQCGLRGIRISHSRPYHPQTCGKVERFHQTLKKWLAAQPRAATLAGLQRQLNRFRTYYNTIRPHRALRRRTPAQAYAARPKAIPTGPVIAAHHRVRTDKIDTLRLGHPAPRQPAAPHRPRRPPRGTPVLC